MCGASISFSITETLITMVNTASASYLSLSDFILVAFILPVIATTSACVVQLLLSFIIRPVTSFALMCGVYVLSAYYTNAYLIGNYTMWLRCSYYDEGGVSPMSGLVLALGLLIVAGVGGYFYFSNIDVM